MTDPAAGAHTLRRGSGTFRFVNVRGDAPPDGSDDVVVLDTSWTPARTGDGAIPIRPVLTSILDAENLFLTSVALLDAWAEACSLPDRLAKDGVTWWFHARSFVRLDLQELLLWGRVVDAMLPPGAYDTIIVPDDRPLLAEAIRARGRGGVGPAIRQVPGTSLTTSDGTGRPVPRRPKERPGIHPARALRSLAVSTAVALGLRARAVDHNAAMEERLAGLSATPGALLAIVRASSFHHVDVEGRLVARDPYVGPVLERLNAAGHRTVTLALKLGATKKAHRQLLGADPTLLPSSLLATLKGGPADADTERAESELDARLAAMPTVPILDGERDLGPAMTSAVASLAPWVAHQWRDMDRAGRLMDILQPGMLLTGWEAARTAWLGAARRRGIPSIAIQHGVIYPATPDYCRPHHPALVRPEVTCVFGPYEREILTREGGYAESAVVATGSPRIDPLMSETPVSPAERAAVRADLGVADGDRILVVSGARMTVGDRLGTVPLLARVLDGALPGIHLVFKLHPEERNGQHYHDLITGLAQARGQAAPPITLTRDIDVYRLLRSADAHLGVLSTVLTDAVFAGTPNLIVVGQAQADLIGYVAAGVATPVRSADDVRAFMADPRPADPEARRRFIAAHFVPGDAAGRIADLVGRAGLAPRDGG